MNKKQLVAKYRPHWARVKPMLKELCSITTIILDALRTTIL